MHLNDLPAHGQPQTGTVELPSGGQAGKGFEETVRVGGIDADAVVGNPDDGGAFGQLRVDFDDRGPVGGHELQGVVEQVGQQGFQQGCIAHDHRERP